MMKKEKIKAEKRTAGSKKTLKQSTMIQLLGGLSACALILVYALLFYNMRTSNHFDVLTEEGDALAGYAEEFVDASAYLTEQVRSYVATGDRTYYDHYQKEVNTDKRREKAVASMQEAGITDQEQEWIRKVQDLSNGLVPLEEQAMNLTQQGGINPAAISMVHDSRYESTVNEIHQIEDQLKNSIWERTTAEQDKMGHRIDMTFYLTYIALALVVAVQILIILYVIRRMLKPLLKIKENMHEMALGNLDAKLDVAEDETEIGELTTAILHTKIRTAAIVKDIDDVLGELADGNFTVTMDHTEYYAGAYESILTSMQTLKQEQSQTLLKIGTAAEQVALGSSQVSDGAQSLAQGATEQASAVEELSATINDISNNAKINAENSALALQHAQEAHGFVSESADNIQKMVEAMGEISQSSQEIGKIIATIENIAFQTNILALNAAVEAARAGSAGKGFAVVADEVRNLASKSDEAAKATKELINSSIESVKHGESIVSQVSKALGSTIQAAEQAGQDIAQITEAITQETESISQVAEGIDQISSVVQTTSATSEESAATSKELSSQAQMLRDLLGKFRIEQEPF